MFLTTHLLNWEDIYGFESIPLLLLVPAVPVARSFNIVFEGIFRNKHQYSNIQSYNDAHLIEEIIRASILATHLLNWF